MAEKPRYQKSISESQGVFLDMLRYALALVVLCGHGLGFYFGYFNGFFPNVFPHPQSIAVVGFFFLSGFLIVYSLKKNGQTMTLGRYLGDRFIRIYVTLIPCLLFVAAVDFFVYRYTDLKLNMVSDNSSVSLFFENIILIPTMPFGTARPIWSLFYEWWLYLLFGGIYWFRSNLFLATILMLGGGYYTYFVNAAGEAGNIWVVWALGGFFGWIQNNPFVENIKRLSSVFAFAFLSMAAVGYFLTKNAYNLPSGLLLSFGLFFLINLKFTDSLVRYKKVAKFLAGFSFTLYLTHYTVLTYAHDLIGVKGVAGYCFGIFASHLVAVAIAFFTELRLSKIKNYFGLNGRLREI